MKTFADAARELGVHPLNLVLRMQGMVGAPADFWPMIHHDLVSAIRARMPEPSQRVPAESPKTTTLREPPVLQLTEDQLKIVLVLRKKSGWTSHAGISIQGMQHLCRGVEDLETVLDELYRLGILQRSSRKGPYWLDLSRKGIIDRTAARYAR